MSCVLSVATLIKKGLLPSFTDEDISPQSSCTAKVAFLAPHILRTVAVYTAVGALTCSIGVFTSAGSILALAALGGVVGAVVGANCIAFKLGPKLNPIAMIDDITEHIVQGNYSQAIWTGEKPILFLSILATISCAIIGITTVGIFAGSAAMLLITLKFCLIALLLLSMLNLISIILAYCTFGRCWN